ncbi:hypothetical protein [Aliidiomarina celeris]|uniref:hypothetical protein n=1 Tax=Aliidiomarina celeris TaxID=2249428 RepID=UPI000DEBD466|nr:hypothetical protein [Aliidiomarina celeris]
MNQNPYRNAGIAALVLAVLFPIYWFYVIHLYSTQSLEAGLLADMATLNAWDALFVLIGALEVYIYVKLSQLCRNHINGGVSATLLLLMAAVVVLFHAAVLVDVSIAFNLVRDPEAVGELALLFSMVCLFVYSVLAFILAISLLIRLASLSMLLKIFAVGLLTAAVLQFTVILGVINTLLFPVLLVVLAVQFLRNDQDVEVV